MPNDQTCEAIENAKKYLSEHPAEAHYTDRPATACVRAFARRRKGNTTRLGPCECKMQVSSPGAPGRVMEIWAEVAGLGILGRRTANLLNASRSIRMTSGPPSSVASRRYAASVASCPNAVSRSPSSGL